MDYHDLDSLISRLEALVHTDAPQRGYWKEVWGTIGEIGASFKDTRYQTREDKDFAWERFQKLCGLAKERGDANRKEMETRNKEFTQRQQEWDHKKSRSDQMRMSIEGRTSGAKPLSGFEKAISDMVLLPFTMIEAVIGKLLGISAKSDFEEARGELCYCSGQLKEAWRYFTDHKHELLPNDKAQCFQTLTSAQDKLNDAWSRLKNAQDAFYEQRRQAHEQHQIEWENKRNEYRVRVEARIENLEAKVDKARNALSRQHDHLDKLESQYSEAWNESFKDRCSVWIDEAKDKIRDIEASIDRMEGWLDEERTKLR